MPEFSTILHGVVYQKIELLITTGVETSDPTKKNMSGCYPGYRLERPGMMAGSPAHIRAIPLWLPARFRFHGAHEVNQNNGISAPTLDA
jgi:hypothetical protein